MEISDEQVEWCAQKVLAQGGTASQSGRQAARANDAVSTAINARTAFVGRGRCSSLPCNYAPVLSSQAPTGPPAGTAHVQILWLFCSYVVRASGRGSFSHRRMHILSNLVNMQQLCWPCGESESLLCALTRGGGRNWIMFALAGAVNPAAGHQMFRPCVIARETRVRVFALYITRAFLHSPRNW
jgi:hypothetical protein